ncbi:MAG: leucine-rich repeat domain-containing protein [Bacteroidaceae bacterium]|nr:leucine-rich repeat domain-containing protein [Bacteroidaceae bacterium]
MFKHIRFLLVSLLLLVAATVGAQKVEVAGLYYELSGTTATVTYPGESAPTAAGTNSYTGDIVIPATINVSGTDYDVTKVGDQAFRYSTVTSITMNEGLVSIGTSAFNNMTEVTELTFPNSFTTVGGGDPLCGCTNLKTVTFGTGLTKIGQGFCFSGTNLENLYFYGTTPASLGAYFCAGCANVPIHVLETAVDTYKSKWTSIGWGSAPNIVGDIEAEYTYTDLQNILGVYSAKLYYVGDGLGFYTEESAADLQTAIAEGSQLTEGLTSAEYRTAVKAIQAAAESLTEGDATVTEGYYYFVCDNAGILANGKSQKAAYLSDTQLFWGELDKNDGKFVIKVTAGSTDGTWTMSDPYNNNAYVGAASPDGSSTSTFCGNFLNSDTPVDLYLTYLGEGSFKWNSLENGTQEWAMCPAGNPGGDKDGPKKVWAYNAAGAPHNEATWVLIPVPQETIDILDYPGGCWELSETATMPQAGKMYAIQNAYSNEYLDANKGVTAAFNATADANVWAVEAGATTTTDQYNTYVLKSVEKDGYWQYVDYASKRWDDEDQTPYDGYDWYNYAGMNAEFGDKANAQEFTILLPTVGADSRTSVGNDGETVEGSYVLTAAATVVDKYYKLGIQSPNAALEPWRERVAWKFYEATYINDIKKELEKAIEFYGNEPTEGSDDPGYLSPNVVVPYAEALEAAKAAQSSDDRQTIREAIDNLKAQYDIIANAEVNPVTDGEYYIVNATPNFMEKQGVEKALYVETTGDYLKWKTLDRADASQVFTIQKLASGNYTIKNYATGAYVTAPTNCKNASQGVWTAEAPADSAEQIIVLNEKWGKAQFELKSTAYSISYHPESNAGGAGATGKIVGWYTAWSDASAWYLYKVEDSDWDAIEQAEVTEALKEAIAEATDKLNEVVEYTKGSDGLINSDASNLSTNASSLNLATLVNGNYDETTETWPNYTTEGVAYLQVDLTGKEVSDFYLTMVPRSGGYYKDDMPKAWTIEASDNATDWTFINTEATDGSKVVATTLYTAPVIHLGKQFKYVRFTSPGSISGRTNHPDHFALAEFQLYAATAEDLEGTMAEKVGALEAAIADAQAKVSANNGTEADIANLKAKAEQLRFSNYWEIATQPSAPEAGKTYVLKNAYREAYLTTGTGTVPEVNPLDADKSIWTVEKADGDATVELFNLKSYAEDAYWQYVNYGEQTWDESTPYDAYDWYDYKGMNAEFGDKANAQNFTILAAQAMGKEDSNNATDQDVIDDSYVIAAEQQIMNKWFKIGVQDHGDNVDAALEPWNEDVAWLFYEATPGTDMGRELELALQQYGQFDTSAGGGTDPGFFNADNFEAYDAALAAAQALTPNSPQKDIRKAIDDLAAAYATVNEVNPITEGYYYFVSAFDDYKTNFGIEKAAYPNVGTMQLYYKTLDEQNAEFIFKVTKADDEDEYWVQNVASGVYVGKPSGWYASTPPVTSAQEEPQNIRLFTTGKFFWGSHAQHATSYTTNTNQVATDNAGALTSWGQWGDAGVSATNFNLWYLRSVPEETVEAILAAALDDAIADLEEIEGSEDPGRYTEAAADAFNEALATAREAAESGTDAEKAEAYQTLVSMPATMEVNPITEGYYFIVSAGDGTGYPGNDGAWYNYEDKNAMYNADGIVKWKAYDPSDVAKLYYLTPNEADASAWYLYSYNDKTYIDNGGSGNSSEVKTSADKVNAQQFNPTVTGSGKFAIKSPSYCYGLAANHNGSDAEEGKLCIWGTVNDCKKFGVNVWFLHKVSDEELELLFPTAHYWDVADEPTAPESGKTYVIKNAVNDLYLIAGTGVAAEYNNLENTAIWQLDETQTEVDGNTTWTLKSIEEDGYWKYINYDEQPGFDGYDWFSYAGMNAEFSTLEDAELFTILTPVQAAEKTRNSVKSDQEVVDGAYVIAAKEQIGGNWFKLDTQRGTNAALAPWQDAPQWLFYEATPGDDLNKELQLALELYDLDIDDANVGDAPGLYDEDNVAAYNDARDIAEGLDETATEQEIRKAINDLRDAYETALEPNPVVDGYYFIVSDNANIAANGKETKALYINTDKSQVWWAKLDQTDLKFVFRITEDGDNWRVQGVKSGLFTGEGFYPDVVSATLDYTYPVTFTAEGEGSFLITANGKRWCPQGNPDGKSDGPNGVWGWNVDGPHGEASFTLRPIDESDLELMVNNALIDVLAEYKDKTFEAKDQPGYAKPENVEAFNDAYATANGLGIASDLDDKIEAVSNLNIAYVKANTEVVPIEDGGYYFMVNKWAGYADKFGVPAAMYAVPGQSTSDTGKHIVRFDKFDETNANYIFKMTQKEGVDNAFYAQSVYTDYYLNTGNGDSWYGELTTISEDPENAQIFTPYAVTGQFFVSDETDTRVSRVIRTSGVQNGTVYGWTTTGDNITDENKWYNAWELIPVAADKVDELVAATKTFDEERGAALDNAVAAADEAAADTTALLADDSNVSEEAKQAIRDAYAALEAAKKAKSYDILTTAEEYTALKDAVLAAIEAAKEEKPAVYDLWQIAEEPSTEFKEGVTYVLKNAYNDKYLSTNGGTVAQVNEIEDFEVFSVEAGEDGVYYLKSATAEAGQDYFQYNDYASKTWDETTPYDGYDWYNYAGFNGEFGAKESAQPFLIQRPTEWGGSDASSAVGDGKDLKEGSYVFAAKEQVMGKWYKLGVQGSDAALEPYNEDVAWFFYEATPVEDASGALDKALAQYGDKEMKGGDAPGFYAADAVAEYNEAVQEAKDAVDSGDDAAKRAAVAALKEAGKKEYATNPIVDGETYFIVSAGYGPGYYTSATPPTEDQWYDDREAYAMYNADGAVKWGQYDDSMTRYAYTFTQDADGNWEVKNVADNSYIGRCVNNEGADAEYSGKVSTTEGVTYKQQFQFISEGKFFMTFVGERGLVTAYALTNSHNGSKNGEAEPGNIGNWGTASEAAKFGVNVWYLIPVSDEMKEKLTAVDGIAAGGEGFGAQGGDGKITFTSDKAQTVRVFTAAGAAVAAKFVEAGETVTFELVPGIYIVNGKKIAVK